MTLQVLPGVTFWAEEALKGIKVIVTAMSNPLETLPLIFILKE